VDDQNWGAALECYQKAAKFNPKDGSIYLSIGSILRIQKDYQGAYEAYQKASELMPEYKYIYLNIAQIETLWYEDCSIGCFCLCV